MQSEVTQDIFFNVCSINVRYQGITFDKQITQNSQI